MRSRALRTARTHIDRLGFPRIVVSKLLGHTEAGVTQIYELHSYDGEKCDALEAWAEAVSGVAENASAAEAS